jgi:hypothetical protein
MIIGVFLGSIGNGPALIQSMPELLVYGRHCSTEGTLEQVI